MALTPHQKKQLRNVLLLLLGVPFVVFGVYKGVQYLLMAGSDPTPRDVIVSNVTTHSFTLSWVTEKPVEAFVIPVRGGVESGPVPDVRGGGQRTSHYVELKNLEPGTEYSLILLSDGERYTAGDASPYTFSTAPIGVDTPVPNPVHGSVNDSSPEDVIVYILHSNKSAYPVSKIVQSNGNWIIELGYFRSISDMGIVRTTPSSQLTVLAKKGSSKTDVLQGEYSSLFSSDSRLTSVLSLSDLNSESALSYFPAQALLGTKQTVLPPVQPEPTEPEPEPLDPEEPEQEVPPIYPYSLRRDVEWIDLAGSMGGGFNLDSGENTVMVTNLTDVGFTVVWTSSSKEEGYIKYGTSKTLLDKEGRDVRDSLTSKGQFNSHYIDTERLDTETTYYFEVYSGTKKYDNNGEKYTVTTHLNPVSPPPFETRSGDVINASDPSDWVVLIKLIDNDELGTSGSSGYISTLPDSIGEWIVTVGNARSEDGTSYFSFSSADILQASFLGAIDTKFDFKLAQNDIQLDVSKVGGVLTGSKVGLLEDYGIVIVR